MKKQYTVGIIAGDGIGRDMIRAARLVLSAVNDTDEPMRKLFFEMAAKRVNATHARLRSLH